jgi:fused signal recognition particle receptor
MREAKKLFPELLKEYLFSSETGGNNSDTEFDKSAFNIILLLGVNGVGKTTTAAKLAAFYKEKGKPLLVAADTFRAAAIDQLKIHGERLGVRVVAHKPNADAAAVVHDAMEAASSGAYNPVIVDTAGRMHTKTALVEELAKISRVIERRTSKAEGGRIIYKKYLILDATTGTNALVQAEAFHQAVQLDGAILTKFDSTARGGVVFPLAVNFGLPVVFVCDGENYHNLRLFNQDEYIKLFLAE